MNADLPPVETGSTGVLTANDRFKRSFGRWFWGSMIAATAAHFSFFFFFPDLTALEIGITSGQLTVLDIPPVVDIPPRPEEISTPAQPIIASTDIGDDVTIPTTTFEGNPPETLSPPPDVVTGTDITRPSPFTPFTVRPSIKNRGEVGRALIREYPPLLRDAGIGGTVLVWFYIDETGKVLNTQVNQTSGHKALDDAAIQVANIIEFTPALNRDKRVAVWISLPITFTAK